jgi:hypothetical protein
MVHHTLECTRGGHEPERHYGKLVSAVSTGKCGLNPI